MNAIFTAGGLAALFLGWNVSNHYPLWTTFHGELAAAVGLCGLFGAVAWPAPAASRVTVRLPLPVASRVCLALAAIPPLQYAFGQLYFRGDALMGALYLSGLGLAIYVGHVWSAQSGRTRVLTLLYLTVLVSAIAAAALAMRQWMRLPVAGWWEMELIDARPFGNLAQPNLFGLLQVMGIVAVTILFEMRVIATRWSLHLVVAMLGAGLLVSGSRACLLALLVIVACWFVSRRRVESRLKPLEVTVALALGFLFHRSLHGIEQALYLAATDARAALDVGPREWIWRHFGAAILAHPWLGYGFDQGSAALREVAASVAPSRNVTFAHNVLLDFMTWFGVPIALLAGDALAVWMFGWLRTGNDGDEALARHGVLAIWLALLVHSMLEFPFAHAFFLFPAGLFAGAITPAPGSAGPTDTGPQMATRPSIGAMAWAFGTMLLLGVVARDYLKFETEFRENRFDKGNFTGKVARPPADTLYVLDHLAALNASAHIDVRPGMPQDQIHDLGKVARRFHLAATRLDYAKALALNGRMPEALAELQVLRSTHHPIAYRRIEHDWRAWLTTHPELRAQ